MFVLIESCKINFHTLLCVCARLDSKLVICKSSAEMRIIMGTIIVGLVLAGIVALIIRSMVKGAKQGKSIQCGGECKHCGGHCH